VSSTYVSRDVVDDPGFRRDAYAGDSLLEGARIIEQAFGGREFRFRPGPERPGFRFASAGDDRLSLHTGTFTGHLQGVIPWSTDYVLTWFQHGSTAVDHPGGHLESRGSRPFLTPAETSFSFAMTPHRHGILRVGADFLEGVAARRHGGPAHRVAFDHAAVPDDDAVTAWRRVLAAATPVVTAEETAPADRLAAQTALADALLDLVPWRPVRVPPSVRTERTRRLRLALEHVQAHAHEDLTPADVARAVGLHERTLQQQMRAHLGVTPGRYLRDVRLDHVRQDLLAAAPGEVLIADVARAWGFRHVGRFSGTYAARFGEHPRQTLRTSEG